MKPSYVVQGVWDRKAAEDLEDHELTAAVGICAARVRVLQRRIQRGSNVAFKHKARAQRMLDRIEAERKKRQVLGALVGDVMHYRGVTDSYTRCGLRNWRAQLSIRKAGDPMWVDWSNRWEGVTCAGCLAQRGI